MGLKKNNPGCNCCGAEDCTGRCLYKCVGELPCPSACAIRIDMPTPDSVPEASGPSCPPADCDLDGLCNACKIFFDGIFYLTPVTTRFYNTSNASVGDICTPFGSVPYANGSTDGNSSGSCDSATILYENTGDVKRCWEVHNVACPECDTYSSYLQCGAMYGIKDPSVKIEITYADGCSTTTVTIEYTVYQYCDEQIILPSTVAASPETTYTHVFQRTNQCDCVDVLGALTFVSTNSVNNERGISVPDVCNAASASVSLVDADSCGCLCFDCFDFSKDINVSFTGADFTGTVVCSLTETRQLEGDGNSYARSPCTYEGTVTADCGRIDARVIITCLPCEKYGLTVYLSSGGSTFMQNGVAAIGLTGPVIFDCTDLTHTFSYSGDCDLGTTLTLS